jgi:hypothetical protein
MNRLLKGLLALHLVFQGTPVATAQPAVARLSPLPQQKVTDDFLSYIHTSSPSIVMDLVNSSHLKSKGTYSFETYVLDLSETPKAKAKAWVAESLRETKVSSPTADVSVINIIDPTIFKLVKKAVGRRPAFSSAPTTPKILVTDIAKLAGVRVQDRMVNPSAQELSKSKTIPAAVILIEKINGAPVNWTFIETHGLGVGNSIALANAVGSLSGQIQFSGPGYNQFSNSAFFRGYAQLVFENQRLSQEYISRPVYAPAQPGQFVYSPQLTAAKIKFLRSMTLQATLIQLPRIAEWINAISTPNFAMGAAESGPIEFLTSGVTKTWHVALESSIEHRRTISPELEERIRKLESRQRWGMFIGEKIFGQLVGSNFGTGPEAWFIFTIAGATAITKIYLDYRNVVRTLNERKEATQQMASAPPPPSRQKPGNCREALGQKSTSRLAGL